jgi:hypothetical protein
VIQYLQDLQEGKDKTISTHRTMRLSGGKAVKHTWNAEPDVEEEEEEGEEREGEDARDTDDEGSDSEKEGQGGTEGMFKQHARAVYAAFCGA